MLQTAPYVLKSSDGTPQRLHGLGLEGLPQLTSDEKSHLLVPYKHWGVTPARLSDYLKDMNEMDSFDVIHQNPHEYRDEEGGLLKREEDDGICHPIILVVPR